MGNFIAARTGATAECILLVALSLSSEQMAAMQGWK